MLPMVDAATVRKARQLSVRGKLLFSKMARAG